MTQREISVISDALGIPPNDAEAWFSRCECGKPALFLVIGRTAWFVFCAPCCIPGASGVVAKCSIILRYYDAPAKRSVVWGPPGSIFFGDRFYDGMEHLEDYFHSVKIVTRQRGPEKWFDDIILASKHPTFRAELAARMAESTAEPSEGSAQPQRVAKQKGVV